MIKIEDIVFYYEDTKVLNGISFEIAPSQKIALLGCNGSGKSTLLRILAGLYVPKSGSYLFDGKEVNSKKVGKSFRKRIGILFQNPESMIFNPTVFDEIAFGLREFGMEDVDERVYTIAKKFGIEGLLKKNPLQLSGGEKQKMMLAALLVTQPDLLLLDEPTASMDPKTSGWFIDLVLDLPQTVLIATHDLALAYESSERAIVLSEAHRIIYDGNIEELFQNLELLQKANLIHKHKHKHRNFFHSHYHIHYT